MMSTFPDELVASLREHRNLPMMNILGALCTIVVRKATQPSRHAWLIGVGMAILGLSACTTSPSHYVERYQVATLKIVFLDQRTLQEEWKTITGRDATQFLARMSGGIPSIKTVRGFYDINTNTVYCEKWDFEICGHELHHAVLGPFHPAN